jgi:nicotinamide riboside kinase
VAFALAATAVYVALFWAFARASAPTPLEIVGTIASLACVWLTRRQNVLCMPLGLVGVVASGWYFFLIGLVGQGWLHVAYYVPTQLWGWWAHAGHARSGLGHGGARRSSRPLLALHPVVRTGLVRRVAIVGAESTGTTTLATALAERLAAPWEPEYGRTFTLERGGVGAIEWRTADFAHIAREQAALEDAAVRRVADTAPFWSNEDGPWVVCDTDSLATSIWQERYLSTSCDEALALAAARPPALYVLTSPDGVAFEQDGIRDGEHLRGWMTERFRERCWRRSRRRGSR